MRCLHYVDQLNEETGGVVRAVLDLVAKLPQATAEPIDVTLLTGDPGDAPPEWLAEGSNPRVIRFDRRAGLFGPSAASSEAIERHVAEADVVHLHTPWDPMNPHVARAARRAGTPYVLSVHGMLDDWSMAQRGLKKRVYLALGGRKMLEHAALVHCTAEAERDQAERWYPRGRTEVLPLVMDLTPYADLPGDELARERCAAFSAAEPTLLFLSRVDPKKGVDALIDAVAQLKARGKPTQAVIAGPGATAYVAQLREQATRRGVADRVHFLGMVRGREKLSLYQACDLYVLPTHQENFGIVLTEAMACGAKVVTTRGVDIWRELERAEATIIDDDPQQLVEALDTLLGDLPAARAAGERSRAAVFDWLDETRVRESYARMYRTAINA
ncbi:GDP-mannose-dependent alpha-(1-2)-phosphatidylinositol mannosyltransferase [Pseudobythopirellula maris]|uniref:GDP-mannose-dependent alpha-(1-2)-phosphatidylinositol mannosyltransferase n=1 Tax=Pseudobythopirellula maris TaxID=2527991 RepID=A0A5C5ZTT9_9BACT|nr:glycosyltransferase [Pseudobythopirellula maris]TWT90952.1 GDP-mannose-dependent alpha-(1-2)-phosphatidylinositol mannosyltransferase [Pseudobythopirellula maris]